MRTKTDPPAGSRLRTPDAASYLGVSASYLEKLRVTGGGPSFAALGRAVSYSVADLDAWAAARRFGIRARHGLSSPAGWLPPRTARRRRAGDELALSPILAHDPRAAFAL